MGRTIKPDVLERIRPLVHQELKGQALAQASGLDERTAREYARHVRTEAAAAAPNGQAEAPRPPVPRIEDVPLRWIHLTGETQGRERLDRQVIAEYVEAMTEGATFPPVVLFFDGEESFWIGDGFHRCQAAATIGFDSIRAEIHEGGQRAARLHAASANQTHGLRRTAADKRHAVMTLLEDEEWRQWSDREIARHCGVDHKSVAKWRRELTGEIPSERTYTTKHGTVATMGTSRIGQHTRDPVEDLHRAPEDTPSPGNAEAVLPPPGADEGQPPASTNGQPTDDIPTSLAPVSEPEADDDQQETWDAEEDEYTVYCHAWAMLSQAHAMWESHVRSGDGDRDRQFPCEVVRRAGADAASHIAALQETANSLQAFAAALRRSLERP
jgi:hypothetical protein